tara:strand:- start:87 stop:614 length:528 start_codon:yes stop_codon:yes gene_type:complete
MTFMREVCTSKIFPEVLLCQHSKFDDLRGSLWTTFDKDLFSGSEPHEQLDFGHDKFATSKKDVIRGIHGDYKSYKLITAVFGKIFQVVVDCREDSVNYLRYQTFELDANQPSSILLPPGFGNAFCALSDTTVYHYKLAYTGKYTDADEQFTYKWNDPKIGIKWPVADPILSLRDE